MNSFLNLNTTWTTDNFLNYIKQRFSSTTADWYASLTEEGKNTLRMMKTPAAMFKDLCKEIEKLSSSKLNLIPKKKQKNGKERLIT